MEFFAYRAVFKNNKWVLQNRKWLFFWSDVYVKELLINGDSYHNLIPTLSKTLGFGENGVRAVYRNKNSVYLKQI